MISVEIFHRSRIVNWPESTVERRSAVIRIDNSGRVTKGIGEGAEAFTHFIKENSSLLISTVKLGRNRVKSTRLSLQLS